MKRPDLLTIGHSTRPLEEFVALLRAHEVRLLADVRTIPRSRRNPQFDGKALARSLRARRIGYRHLKALGGLRKPRAGSAINAGWRNASFRGYADHMRTPEFEEGLELLLGAASRRRTAIMCAEAVPWRCHRSIIADALTARGMTVGHIMSAGPPRLHRLNPMARRRAGRLAYPARTKA